MGIRHKTTGFVGLGIGLIMWILEMADVTLPLLLLIVLGVLALGMIVYGAIPTVPVVLQKIRRLRIQSPITFERSGSTTHDQELTQEQVVERLAFIHQSQAVAERLMKNTQTAETESIFSIFLDICREPPVKEYVANDGLAGQAIRLLKNKFDNLFVQVGKHHNQTEGLSTTVGDRDVHDICNTTTRLVLGYRQLVDETLKLLDNLANKEVPALWQSSPWSMRIHRYLADNYDELMRLVVDLRTATPKNARIFLPTDDQLTRFSRNSLYA